MVSTFPVSTQGTRPNRVAGNGYGLLQPVASADLTPPCAGYFDRNGDWTLIANLSSSPAATHPDYSPLAYAPRKTTELEIEWQPKTSLGVTAVSLDTSVETPNNVPGGADAHVKYASRSNFGAVLMTLRPVALHAYNDERLFLAWLAANRAALYAHHGPELKKYGLWVVTRTHRAPGCSINAWMKASQSTLVSLKAKAAMMGELGQGLGLQDQVFDKDWCHYRARKGEDGVVLFLDGIEVKAWEWKLQGIKQSVFGRGLPPVKRTTTGQLGEPTAHPAIPIRKRASSSSRAPKPGLYDDAPPEKSLAPTSSDSLSLVGSLANKEMKQLMATDSKVNQDIQEIITSEGQATAPKKQSLEAPFPDQASQTPPPRQRNSSALDAPFPDQLPQTPSRRPRNRSSQQSQARRPHTYVEGGGNDDRVDLDTLQDAGLLQFGGRRSASLRKSPAPRSVREGSDAGSRRSRSLRRESRSIADDK